MLHYTLRATQVPNTQQALLSLTVRAEQSDYKDKDQAEHINYFLDVSQNMDPKNLQYAKTFVTQSINDLPDHVYYTVKTFDNLTHTIARNELKGNQVHLDENLGKIADIKADSKSKANLLSVFGKEEKGPTLLLTTGINDHGITADAILKTRKENQAPIYTIGIGAQHNATLLGELAKKTGSVFMRHIKNDKDINAVFDELQTKIAPPTPPIELTVEFSDKKFTQSIGALNYGHSKTVIIPFAIANAQELFTVSIGNNLDTTIQKQSVDFKTATEICTLYASREYPQISMNNAIKIEEKIKQLQSLLPYVIEQTREAQDLKNHIRSNIAALIAHSGHNTKKGSLPVHGSHNSGGNKHKKWHDSNTLKTKENCTEKTDEKKPHSKSKNKSSTQAFSNAKFFQDPYTGFEVIEDNDSSSVVSINSAVGSDLDDNYEYFPPQP